MPSPDGLANFAFTFGSFIFAGVGLVVAGLTIFAGYVTFRAERVHKSLEADLTEIRRQQAKVNNTLIVTSDLAIQNLPQITFTQQIPAEVIDDVGIIDDIFDGPNGSQLWRSIADQPRAARLAYARAVYRLGRNPLSRKKLIGYAKREPDEDSVAGLLESALEAAEHTNRDPISLRRNILVRKNQAYRQAGDFDSAELAARDIYLLHKHYEDIPSEFLGPWCSALTHLQRSAGARKPEDRVKSLRKAINELSEPFDKIFGQQSEKPPFEEVDRLNYYRRKWQNIELGSIAFYTAKALWSYTLCIEGAGLEVNREPQFAARLHRSLDISLLFYEDTRRRLPPDPCISCIYHLCVPLLVAVRNALPERDLSLEEFSSAFPSLSDNEALKKHAQRCLDDCADKVASLRYDSTSSGIRYIYSESSERLDKIAVFSRDVGLVQKFLERPTALREFYRTLS